MPVPAASGHCLDATSCRNRRSMDMETRILVLAALLAAAGCAEHRVATAPPGSAPASAVATAPTTGTTATATIARAQPQPQPQTQPEPRFYTPSEQQSQVPASIQGNHPVQAAQPEHALGQPAGQDNTPTQNAYNAPPQSYTPSGLNSDPNNPSGAPGYSPLHGF